jgi:hypothetical protein
MGKDGEDNDLKTFHDTLAMAELFISSKMLFHGSIFCETRRV